MRHSITAIILNYKNSDDTLGCFNSLKKSDLGHQLNLLIIDNSADTEETRLLQKKFPGTSIIVSPKNLGFAGGNNQGINIALESGSTHILIINPDVRVGKVFFEPLLKHFKDDSVGIVAPAIRHTQKGKEVYGFDGKVDWLFAKPTHRNSSKNKMGKPVDSEFVTFACALFSADTFKKAGLLDDGYFMYFEDVDYCLTAKKHDVKILLDPKVVVDHNTSSSFKRPTGKLLISFRSHLRFISKWLSFPNNLRPLFYALTLYPYLYVLWTYHFYKYSKTK